MKINNSVSTTKKRIVLFLILGILIYFISSHVNDYRNYQGFLLSIYTIAITCVILLTGYSGQLSLGQGAFMATGAYSSAIAFTNLKFTPVISLVLAVLFSGFFGLLIGLAVARFSGPYLAGTTLALAFSLPALLSTFTLFGAGEGIEFVLDNPFEKFFPGKFSQDQSYFLIGALAALITLLLITNIMNAKFGRIWRAIRDNETSAALSGINVATYKVLAFTISSGFSGLAGALLAISISGATPSAFPLSLSFLVLTGAVVTGLYSLRGVIFGSFIVVVVPSLIESFVTGWEESDRLTSTIPGLMVSGLLIVAVLFSPNGPADLIKKKK